MSGFTRPTITPRVFEVDYFFQKRVTRPLALEGVLELPQQPLSIEELDVHSFQTHYSINGERIIRRPIQQHKPKRVTLNFIISLYPQLYPSSAVPSPIAPARNVATHAPVITNADAVLSRFSELVQEMRSSDSQYDFINLRDSVIYRNCELENYVVTQNVTNTRLGGYSVTITFLCYQKSAYTGPTISRAWEMIPHEAAAPILAELSTYDSVINAMQGFANTLTGIANTVNGVGAALTDAIQNNRLLGATLNIVDAATSITLSVANQLTNTIAAVENVRDAVANRSGQALHAVAALLRSVATLEQFVGLLATDPLTFLKPITESVKSGASSVSDAAGDVAQEWQKIFYGDSGQKVTASEAVQVETGANALLLNDLINTVADLNYIAELSYGFLYRRAPRDNSVVRPGSFLADGRNIAALASFSGNTVTPAVVEDQDGLPYQLRMGETLMDLSHRLTGDPNRWVELASFNSWTSPYTDSQDRVVRAGTQILIPLRMLPDFTADMLLNALITRGDPLLTDMKLSDTGDLILEKDIQLVSGPANFTQALVNRARTVRGEQLSLPQYGIANLAGSMTGRLSPALLASELTSQLLRDPRVQTISNVAVELTGDTLDAKLTVSTITQEVTNLVIPLN